MDKTFTTDKRTESLLPLYELDKPTHTKVSYHYNPKVTQFHYGTKHPMKPFRLMLTDHLVTAYKLYERMDLYEPRKATREELAAFHSDDYLDFLQKVTPENASKFTESLQKFSIGDDCPVFDGVFDYASIYAGASLDGTRKLISGGSDIAINWSGGLHHAKKGEPSGFCYANDIVLSILNMLRVYPRVLYIDIDLHHGDGVQEAFYTTDRVMTVSFHRYDGTFFPGTGNYDESGVGAGKHFALNVPLNQGIDDDNYTMLFKSVMDGVISRFQPYAIVLQCGADSLGHDRLGGFNLNISAHGECVSYIKSFGIPLLVVGGGGYTPRNVSRLWCYETGILTNAKLQTALPDSLPLRNFFAPDYSLHPNLGSGSGFENLNTRKYLENVRIKCMETLRFLNGAPSVEMSLIPPDIEGIKSEQDEQAIMERFERDSGFEEWSEGQRFWLERKDQSRELSM